MCRPFSSKLKRPPTSSQAAGLAPLHLPVRRIRLLLIQLGPAERVEVSNISTSPLLDHA